MSDRRGPQSSGAYDVLHVHVGRLLLGFPPETNRRKYLRPVKPPTPEQVVAAYEKLFDDAVENYPALSEHQEKYIEARLQLEPEATQAQFVVDVHRRILEQLGRSNSQLSRRWLGMYAYRHFRNSPCSFEEYIDALIETGQQQVGRDLVKKYESEWDSSSGRQMLGAVSFRLGDKANALRLLETFCSEDKRHYVADEVAMLAELWHESGQTARAKELLLTSLESVKKAQAKVRFVRGSPQFEDVYDAQRGAYLRLFPETGEAELAARGIAKKLSKSGE